MPDDALSSLIGSRICHDLISPLGAIGNGIELMSMAKTSTGPEMDLITQSVQHANAKLRFFRLAFGAAGEQDVRAGEVVKILTDYSAGTKIDVTWRIATGQSRSITRACFLAILCLETAAPFGGEITITERGGVFCLTLKSARILWDEALWSRLQSGSITELTASQVQFGLLARALPDIGRHATIVGDETERVLRLAPA